MVSSQVIARAFIVLFVFMLYCFLYSHHNHVLFDGLLLLNKKDLVL